MVEVAPLLPIGTFTLLGDAEIEKLGFRVEIEDVIVWLGEPLWSAATMVMVSVVSGPAEVGIENCTDPL